MRFRKLGLAILGVFLAVSIATAQGLDTLLPRAGETGCYGRVYDKAHLASHPDQLVTSMLISLRERKEPMDDGAHGFEATIGVSVRGQSKRHVTATICRRYPGSQIATCSLECDMGVFSLVPSTRQGSLTLELDRLAFEDSCAGGDTSTFELTPGKDDRTFRLDPARRSDCSNLEKQFQRNSR